jgi:acyl-CoA thioesterase-1
MFKLIHIILLLLLPRVCISQTEKYVYNYVAIGDAYTLGEGLEKKDRFPSQLADRFRNDSLSLSFELNFAKSGYIVKDLLSDVLPIIKELNPDFISITIGAYDWIIGKKEQQFGSDLEVLFRKLMLIKSKPRIVLFTIPDISHTKDGLWYSLGRNPQEGIQKFNEILIEKAALYQIPVADIYQLSLNKNKERNYICWDEFHPSRLQYEKWVDLMYPLLYKEIQYLNNDRTQN